MYNILSTFTGGGGLDIGFHGDFEFLGNEYPRLKFSTKTSLDLNPFSCQTILSNQKYFKDTNVNNVNILEYDKTNINGKYDLLLGGFPCFLKGTKVFTKNGYKNIEDIIVGDLVLTHKNRYRKVLIVMKNSTDIVHYIKTLGVPRIKTTSNHPFYIRKNKSSEPEWINAEELKKGNFIGMNINKESVMPTWNGIETIVNQSTTKTKNELSQHFTNPIFWWIVGRYIADGWLINYLRKPRKNSYVWKTYICAGYSEKEEIESMFDQIDLHYTIDNDRTVIKYIFSNEELYKFLEQFKKYAYGKSINNTILDLPKEYLKSFLDGYISGDGCYYEKTKVTSFHTASKELALGIQQAIHKVYRVPCKLLYVKTKDTTIIEGRTVNQRNGYRGSFIIESIKNTCFIKDDIFWMPLKENIAIQENKETYNLSVDEDNSYTAQNVIVHNCLSFSMAGNRLGVKDDITGKLYDSYAQYVEHFKPKVFLAENVKGLLSANKGEAIKIIKQRFEDTGYKVKIFLVNFAEFGVPQLRERVLFIGVRDDIDLEFVPPEKTHNKETYVTSEEAFEYINPECINHKYTRQLAKTTERIGAIPEGGNFKDLPEHLAIKGMMSNIYRRLDRTKPAYTVIASGGGGTWTYHYSEPRALTNRERARLQGFPDDLIFEGTNTEIRRQIGNAVPPLGIYHFAKRIQDLLDGKTPKFDKDKVLKEYDVEKKKFI